MARPSGYYHRGSLCERLGLPPHARTHPDPAVRRQYFKLQKRDYLARKRNAKPRSATFCDWKFGHTSCGTPLVLDTDRLGRLVATCPACERRRAGQCQCCPAAVDGTIGQALYCARCRPVMNRRREREKKAKPHHLEKAAANKRARRRFWRRALTSRDPVLRAAAVAYWDRRRAEGRAARARFVERHGNDRRAGGARAKAA